MNIVFLGLSITSSWGNGHATTYRALIRELHRRGHQVTFLERDTPWYASARDLLASPFCQIKLYRSLDELRSGYRQAVASADAVIVGSYVPDGIAVLEWVLDVAGGTVAFYDIDTPVTMESLEADRCEYLEPATICSLDLYLSFTGGPLLTRIADQYGARRVAALHCSVDPEAYNPYAGKPRWDLGYLGTYSDDRQSALEKLLVNAARTSSLSFVVAGSLYPVDTEWPRNVERIEHLPPAEHRRFYGRQRFTLNLTRSAMIRAGFSPSVRLFEAAACGTPIISDAWPGLEDFFEPSVEILIAHTAEDVLRYLTEPSEEQRTELARRARQRILAAHTAAHRACELEQILLSLRKARRTMRKTKVQGMAA